MRINPRGSKQKGYESINRKRSDSRKTRLDRKTAKNKIHSQKRRTHNETLTTKSKSLKWRKPNCRETYLELKHKTKIPKLQTKYHSPNKRLTRGNTVDKDTLAQDMGDTDY